MSGNGVILTRGALTGNIYGAKSESKVKADSNYVTVSGGSVSGSVYGGWSTSDDAQNNNVSLSSVHIGGDVVGGYGKSAKNNSVTLRGWGVAAAYSNPGDGFARLDYARRIGLDSSVAAKNSARGRLWFLMGKIW